MDGGIEAVANYKRSFSKSQFNANVNIVVYNYYCFHVDAREHGSHWTTSARSSITRIGPIIQVEVGRCEADVLKQSWYDNDYLMGRLNYWKPLKTTFVDINVVRTRFEVVSGEHVRGLTSIKVDAKIIVHWMSLSLDGLEIKRGGWSITCLKIKSKYHWFKMRFNLGMEAKMTREMTDSHDHQM